MYSRRSFLSKSLLGSMGAFIGLKQARCAVNPEKFPLVISTWNHGIAANEAAWKVLSGSGRAIDAVEKGVMVVEADPENGSVGIGGMPDRDGKVTLDASIMDDKGNCGSVCFLQNIKHPISVARKVMEDTPHVLLAGSGALKFALSQGFKEENLLTEAGKRGLEKWRIKHHYQPEINIENHDTIGLLAIDNEGNISGACTTSGLAYKMSGRVGDSPIIGAGLFVDNEVGGATATGLGEEVIRICGSFLIVELMRQGKHPQEACEIAVMRIVNKRSYYKNLQVGFLAVNKAGEHGAYSIHEGFNYALKTNDSSAMHNAGCYSS